MPQEALNLPWQTQLVLVAGYFGYIIAYAGRRGNHDTIDVVALILCFGSSALLVLSTQSWFVKNYPAVPVQLVGAFAVLSSIFAGAIWRSFARQIIIKLIRLLSKSDDDGMKSAWDSITQMQGLAYSQLNVTLTDGRIFESYPLGDFNTWPNGPCIFGGDGAIGMYVTHIHENDKRRDVEKLNTDEGMRITFIPSEMIQEVDFRRNKKNLEKKPISSLRYFLGLR